MICKAKYCFIKIKTNYVWSLTLLMLYIHFIRNKSHLSELVVITLIAYDLSHPVLFMQKYGGICNTLLFLCQYLSWYSHCKHREIWIHVWPNIPSSKWYFDWWKLPIRPLTSHLPLDTMETHQRYSMTWIHFIMMHSHLKFAYCSKLSM